MSFIFLLLFCATFEQKEKDTSSAQIRRRNNKRTHYFFSLYIKDSKECIGFLPKANCIHFRTCMCDVQ